MNRPRLAISALVLAVGYALAAGFFWLLLNVPESNVLALGASALALLSVVACAGLTTTMAVNAAEGFNIGQSARRAIQTLPLFLAGLIVFALLWWATAGVDVWWTSHRGEIDAVFLRYLGVTKTSLLHGTEAWVTWAVRWGLGLSTVAALAAAGAAGAQHALSAGLRGALRLAPLAVVIVAAAIVSQGISRWAYWRPAGLSPTSAELAFVVVKLGLLYLLVIALAVLVLDVHRRAATRTA